MKFALCLAFLISLVAAISADKFTNYFSNADYNDKCVKEGLVLSPGESAQLPNRCGKVTCSKKSIATVFTCGVYPDPEPGNKWGPYVYESAPYPDCCQRYYLKIETLDQLD